MRLRAAHEGADSAARRAQEHAESREPSRSLPGFVETLREVLGRT